MKSATLIKPDGSETVLHPENPKEGFSLKELYKLLDCDMVEKIDLADGRIMLVDEEFRLRSEPVLNQKATKLFRQGRPTAAEYRKKMKEMYGDAFIDMSDDGETDPDSIYGIVLVCPPEMFL